MSRARSGDPVAQYLVAFDYLVGLRGGEPNEDKAIFWYKKSSLQGLPEASSNLSTILWNKDRSEAIGWLILAAKQGGETGQERLTRYYKTGKHMAKDDVLSYAWMLVLDKSCIGASGKTRMTPEDIKEGMTQEEKQEAIVLSERFRDKIRMQAWKQEAAEEPPQLFEEWKRTR